MDTRAVDEVYARMSGEDDDASHDNAGPAECIDAIQAVLTRDAFAAFCQGNSIKHIWRYQFKRTSEDLETANWYLARLRKVESWPA